MTAAPGPQQPDEVLLDLLARRILNTVDPAQDGFTVRAQCVELVRRYGAEHAAPSAQPDEVDDDPCEDCRNELDGEPCSYHADHPAQPVRDTEEGRR